MGTADTIDVLRGRRGVTRWFSLRVKVVLVWERLNAGSVRGRGSRSLIVCLSSIYLAIFAPSLVEDTGLSAVC